MPAKKKPTKSKAPSKSVRTARREPRVDVPQFFRLNVEVADLDAAVEFYGRLLALQGRKQAGSRCYFECERSTPGREARRRAQTCPETRFRRRLKLDTYAHHAEAIRRCRSTRT